MENRFQLVISRTQTSSETLLIHVLYCDKNSMNITKWIILFIGGNRKLLPSANEVDGKYYGGLPNLDADPTVGRPPPDTVNRRACKHPTGMHSCHHLQTKLRESNVFTCICMSTGGWCVSQLAPGQGGVWTGVWTRVVPPPPPVMATEVDGTHPTGMHIF